MQKVQTCSTLRVVNARENNLKNISLELEHDCFTVVTGLSGSGKSSLAFDTVYAEGQRRYIETFSPYTRQFLDRIKKPEADALECVRPAVAIEQRTRVSNSRSTVGSMTNINDYLAILWANLAEPVCPTCEVPLRAWPSSDLATHLLKLLALKSPTRLLIVAPVALGDGVTSRREIERLILLGYSRALDHHLGEILQLENLLNAPKKTLGKTLFVVLDRVSAESATDEQLREVLGQAYSLGRGVLYVVEPESSSSRPFRQIRNTAEQRNLPRSRMRFLEFRNTLGCERLEKPIERPRPSLFSFNNSLGACGKCRGFGNVLELDLARCIPDQTLSITNGALHPWRSPSTKALLKKLIAFCESQKISTTCPWSELTPDSKEKILHNASREYRGLYPWFKRLERKIYKVHVRVFLSRYRHQVPCPTCLGARLNRDALAYRVAGKHLAQIWQLQIAQLLEWITEIEQSRVATSNAARELDFVFSAVRSRLRFLIDLGLPYLTLDRQARSLSGGETQRVNLTTALGSELVSTQFVLDEPTVGLHPRDTSRMIAAIKNLAARGNSLLVVEHDPECINSADRVLEIGPGSGTSGGSIVYHGEARKWSGLNEQQIRDRVVLTGRKLPDFKRALKITNATARNLKGGAFEFPLGSFVALTGVSGSGKSTLIREVIERGYENYTKGLATAGADLVSGFADVTDVKLVDQSPLVKSPRANIATYSGIWDTVRDLLAGTSLASQRALSRSSFSFNVDAGRCTTCRGAGAIREEMQFLSDILVPCEICLGKRFQQAVLEVEYRGKNVDDLLRMTVAEAREFFAEQSAVREKAALLDELGLGHLTLGHPLSELSGGEAQRLKLVPFVAERGERGSLLIFDEPTTGLHLLDVERLITLFRRLRDDGHSILCVEHNLLLIAAADWIVDIGPEGGAEGGELVAEGSAETLIQEAKRSKSYTAQYLAQFFDDTKRATPRLTKNGATTNSPHQLTIRDAHEHNLKHIDLEIPYNSIVALTGVSGSGKSTIARDIVFAESQRRFLDCLSPYARQFIKELRRPAVGSIENLKPTVCVAQHTFQPSALSTVATVSEVYHYLRLLFAKTATQYCPDHPDAAIAPLSPGDIAAEIRKRYRQKIRILSPVIKLKKGAHKQIFQNAIDSEIYEVRVDGKLAKPQSFSGGLVRNATHSVDYVIARCNPHTVAEEDLSQAIAQALALGGGTVTALSESDETVYSTERTCPECKTGFFKPDPEDLSFNSRRGRCSVCEGSGVTAKGTCCKVCDGTRIKPVGRHLRLNQRNIFEVASLTAPEIKVFLEALRGDKISRAISNAVLDELLARLETLIDLGLDYIPLSRECSTLSGGELQRLRLATALSSPLSGTLYILDEPSAGLHPVDNQLVLRELRRRKELGNSILLIEHDLDSIRAADYVIDVGPEGGKAGGEIVFAGPIEKLPNCKESITAQMIDRGFEISNCDYADKRGSLSLKDGSRNNIKSIDLTLPLRSLIVVAGVSGAGKSSLVHGIFSRIMTPIGKGRSEWREEQTVISSSEVIDRMLVVDQKPIGATSRSTPASYLKVWDHLRKIFAETLEAKALGWGPAHFSYNAGKGRCQTCGGTGQLKLEMNFLADAEVVCPACFGERFNQETNSIKYLGLSPSAALNLTFAEAAATFTNHRKVHRLLHLACDVGLGYLTLGQSSKTLSGGESQRLKLVAELGANPRGHTLYILDEPTVGLHRADVALLLVTLRRLVDEGNTVLIIEHDSDLICSADHLVELGPGAGSAGGKVIYQGSPSKLIGRKTPWGAVLRNLADSSGPQSIDLPTGQLRCGNELSLK